MFIWRSKRAAGPRRNNMKSAQLICRITFLTVLSMGTLQAQDSAIFDAPKNSWHLQYQDPETMQWMRKTYAQQNAISPTIQSTIFNSQSHFVYGYRVNNRRDAKQLVDTFRIWGIPLIYQILNLPPVTASARTDPESEDKQQWAQLRVKSQFEKITIAAPRGWSAALRVDERAGQTSFVWTPGLRDTDPDGIQPGQSQEGFTVYRAELPGIARAKLTGSTDEPWGLDNLPDTPFWRGKIQEIQDRDYVLVPVLAPVIPLPSPYNAATLARSLRSHVQTWLKYGHLSPDVLATLNRQFDVLVPALEIGNRRASSSAIEAMLKECRHHHANLSNEHIGRDDDRYDAIPMHSHAAHTLAAQHPGIDRVAARALIFNLLYIQRRLANS